MCRQPVRSELHRKRLPSARTVKLCSGLRKGESASTRIERDFPVAGLAAISSRRLSQRSYIWNVTSALFGSQMISRMNAFSTVVSVTFTLLPVAASATQSTSLGVESVVKGYLKVSTTAFRGTLRVIG